MSASNPSPPPFTTHDYEVRMERVVADAVQAGVEGGLLVTPGPDLVWLTGYRPTAITERLTVLVLRPGHEPTLLVPLLERPDAEGAAGAAALTIRDWTDGSDPYAVARGCWTRPPATPSRTRRGRCTSSACSSRCRALGTGR